MLMLPKQMTNILFSIAIWFQLQLDFSKKTFTSPFRFSFYKLTLYGYTEGLFFVMQYVALDYKFE